MTERLALAAHGYGIAARSLGLTAAYCRDARDLRPAARRPTRWCGTGSSRCTAGSTWRAATPARSAARYVAGEQPLVEALHAKATAVEAAAYVCDQAVQLHGGTGYLHGTEVERHYRDARILGIGGGATEVLDDLTARLLGYAP